MRRATLRALFANTIFECAMFAMTMTVIPFARLASQEARPANVPTRELSKPTATSSEYFKLIMNVRGLPDGKLLVNDAKRHKLMLLDSQLRTSAVVLDSVSGASQGYGGGYTPIIPYLGDSTLYADGDANMLVMIAPNGTIGRAVAPPVRKAGLS